MDPAKFSYADILKRSIYNNGKDEVSIRGAPSAANINGHQPVKGHVRPEKTASGSSSGPPATTSDPSTSPVSTEESDMDFLLCCLADVSDNSIPDTELATLVAIDCERAHGRTTEVGLDVLPLAALRKQLRGTLSLHSLLSQVTTTQIRVRENATMQLKLVKKGESLWAAPYPEFGVSIYVNEADVGRVMVSTILESAQLRRRALFGRSKPKLITIGHAFANYIGDLIAFNYNPGEAFQDVKTVDTQVLAKTFSGLATPGLTNLLRMMGISSIERHNASNDAFYTLTVLCVLVLIAAQNGGHFAVSGNPLAEAKAAVDAMRVRQYSPTASYLASNIPLCNCCGLPYHTMEHCLRRCGYCHVYRPSDEHTYTDCPVRMDDLGQGVQAASSFLQHKTGVRGF